MTLLSNRSNVRTNLRIDRNKKIWADSTLDRYINEGQRWLLNDPSINWPFQQAFGYLVPVDAYQEYRQSSDDNPENFFSSNIKQFIRAKTSIGNEIAFGRSVNFTNSVVTAPSLITEYANRFFLNAGYDGAANYTTIHNMDSFDGDGTWTASNDTTNVATDSSEFKEGSGSVSFDADVSQSTTNKVTITNSDMATVDLSSIKLNESGVIMWVYFPSVTNMKSVEILFGSDSSNYYSAKQYETDVQGNKYQSGWTRIFIPTLNRRTEGSPNMSSVGYVQVNIQFDAAQGDVSGFRIDNIQLVDKYLQYDYARKSEDMSSDSEESVVPSEYQFVYELYGTYKAWVDLPGKEKQADIALKEARLNKNIMIEEFGYLTPQSFTMPPR